MSIKETANLESILSTLSKEEKTLTSPPVILSALLSAASLDL